MTDSKDQNCGFCNIDEPIMSIERDELWYINPNSALGKSIRTSYHENVQFYTHDQKYNDARLSEGPKPRFWFNYCPMCGRKL